MSEDKIELEQTEAFTDELSDEALDRGVGRACSSTPPYIEDDAASG